MPARSMLEVFPTPVRWMRAASPTQVQSMRALPTQVRPMQARPTQVRPMQVRPTQA